MATRYSGNPANVTSPLIRTITGAAAGGGGVIVISTSAAHAFANDDRITITGVVGTTEANGTWFVTVLSSTTFSLNGSTFVNAYVSGGLAYDTSLTPAVLIPSDGDAPTADSVAVPLQTCLDRTQFLMTQGLSNIRTVGNFAALTALASPIPYSIAQVLGDGLYVYDPASGATVDGYFTINGPAGVGRWFAVDILGQNRAGIGRVASGVNGAAANRIIATLVPNRLVDAFEDFLLVSATNATGAYVTAQSMALGATVAGDILAIDVSGVVRVADAGLNIADVRIRVNQDAGATVTVLDFFEPPNFVDAIVAATRTGTFARSYSTVLFGASTTTAVEIQITSPGPTTVTLVGGATGGAAPRSLIRVQRYRP